MVGELAYSTFVRHRSLVRDVYRATEILADGAFKDHLLQSIVVRIMAELEELLRMLLQEQGDLIVGGWDEMSPAQQKIVATKAREQLAEYADRMEIAGTDDAERFKSSVDGVMTWFTTAGAFAKAVSLSVGDIYKAELAPAGLSVVLVQFRQDAVRFFDWLEARGADRSSYWVSLQQMVELRNDIAHGLHQKPQPTDAEVRTYLVRTALLARYVVSYLRGQ